MILITGANGHLGSQTIDYLLDRGISEQLGGLVRSEEKGSALKEKGVELKIGDYTDFRSMQQAMKEVDTLLLISSSTMEDRVQQHRNAIQAAADEGVQQIFYTSMLQADKELSPMAHDHARTEEILKKSGVPYSIYRHTFYTEFLPLFWGDALKTGEWRFPSGGQKINLAYRSEMAEALANGLEKPGHHKNNIYEITSLKAYSLEEIAEMMSRAAGREITYVDVPVPKFANNLEKAGLPKEQVVMSVMTAKTFANGALNYTFQDLENLLGRPPAGIESFISEYINP